MGRLRAEPVLLLRDAHRRLPSRTAGRREALRAGSSALSTPLPAESTTYFAVFFRGHRAGALALLSEARRLRLAALVAETPQRLWRVPIGQS